MRHPDPELAMRFIDDADSQTEDGERKDVTRDLDEGVCPDQVLEGEGSDED
jgi:hypothetical protein